jgi:hypothetical protein
MVSTLSDNWVYLGKVGLYRWSNDQEDYLISQINSVTSFMVLLLELLGECLRKKKRGFLYLI